jgi:DNA-binding response OmpR family regulator
LDRACCKPWTLIVLDLSLPQLDGVELCRRLRARRIFTPLLMLTARGSESERATGLDAGADDYLTKPFGILEFIARVKALLRRAQQFGVATDHSAKASRRLFAGDLALDINVRAAWRAGAEVPLTAREFDLLQHFATHPGRVFTRAQLLDRVWGSNSEAYEHAVSSHINRLRAKIEVDPQRPRHLVTVWGVGYRFDAIPR